MCRQTAASSAPPAAVTSNAACLRELSPATVALRCELQHCPLAQAPLRPWRPASLSSSAARAGALRGRELQRRPGWSSPRPRAPAPPARASATRLLRPTTSSSSSARMRELSQQQRPPQEAPALPIATCFAAATRCHMLLCR
uniref:Uncharacterized protein n=1 Tax=Arundo donax TaxID=35708 RepID=A0A0A9TX93_ARUDO